MPNPGFTVPYILPYCLIIIMVTTVAENESTKNLIPIFLNSGGFKKKGLVRTHTTKGPNEIIT